MKKYTSYPIALTQQSAVCMGNSRGKQNIFYTHDFVQGGRLWGYAINKYYKKYNRVHDDFFNDNIRFHNCYIQVEEPRTVPALPVPLSLFTCKTNPYSFDNGKSDGHDLVDLLFDDDTMCRHCGEDSQLRQLRAGYLYKDDNRIGLYHPRKIIEMHNRIDKDSQNTLSDSLFSYQLLDEPGKKFLGHIQVAEDSDLHPFIRELNGQTIGVGKARTSGYGCVELHLGDSASGGIEHYFDKEFEDTVNVCLLSDLIITDEMHRYQTVLTPRLMGLDSELKLEKSFCRSEVLQGFNAKHQRTRIDDVAIKKGSCFLYSLKPGANRETIQTRIRELETGGLGFRKSEGYGRLRFNRKPLTVRMPQKQGGLK